MATRGTTTSSTRATTAEQGSGAGWIPRRAAPKAGLGLQAALAAPFLYLFAAALMLAGANSAASALVLVFVNALALLAWLTLSRQARDRAAESGVLAGPGLCFLAVLVVGAWSLTAFTPGGPLPVWSWVGKAGAATLDLGATAIELVKLSGLACIFLVGFIQGGRSLTSTNTLKLLVLTGTAYGVISLGLFLSSGLGFWRMTGGFRSANTTGTLFGMLAVLALSWTLQAFRSMERDGKWRNAVERLGGVAPRAATAIVLTGCLLLTASRSAVAITAVTMTALVLWELASGGLKARSNLVMIGAWAVYLVVMIGGAGAVALTRFGKLAGDVTERGEMFSAHWKMFTISPLFGWGLGAFDQINQQAMTSANNPYLWRLRATHNVVLQWLEEAGLIGAAPMFLCIALVIGLTAWGLRLRQETAPWIRALLLTNALIIAHGMSDFAIQVPMVSALWAFLLGLQLSMAYPQRRRSPGR